jgi:hypothetical protein
MLKFFEHIAEQEFVSKAGAGEEGRPELVKKYKKETPGQTVKEDAEQCTLYTSQQLKDLETFADRLLKKYQVDIQFTKHFAERMSDARNVPCIKITELQQFFKKIEKNKAAKIKAHGDGQAVLVDLQKDLNLPVVIDIMGDSFEVRMKTIMRKKDFKTSDDKIAVESFLGFIDK